jgi:hypothetical protein
VQATLALTPGTNVQAFSTRLLNIAGFSYTTGCYLKLTSSTAVDCDTPAGGGSGDLTEVQAGSGISVANGTGPIPVVSADTAVMLSRATDQAGTDKYAAPASASGTTYTASLTPALTAYTTGQSFIFKPDTNNTGTPTLNINGLGAITMQKMSSGTLTNLSANDLDADGAYLLIKLASVFLVVPLEGGSGSSAFSAITTSTNTTATMTVGTGATITTSGSGTIVATSAAALATNPTDCGSNQFAYQIAANGNLTCQALVEADLPTRTFRVSMLNGFTMPDTSGNVFSEPFTVKAAVGADFWGHNVWVYNNTSTDLILHGVFELPNNFVSGAKACVIWTSSDALANDVRWQFGYRATSGTESLDQTTAMTTIEANATVQGTAQNPTRTCLTLTDADFAAGDTVQFRAAREGSDTANDTMSGVAIVFAWQFEYQGR